MNRSSLTAVVVAALALAGCGGDGKDKQHATTSASQPKDVLAQSRHADKLRKLSTAAATAGGGGVDLQVYDNDLASMVDSINAYWRAEYASSGEPGGYKPPHDVIAYAGGDSQPTCGGAPPAPMNAFYCSNPDLIAWDEKNLLIPYYRDKGDLAVGIILAHEWGHLIQQRLGLQFKYTIEAELHADCLAGAWLGEVEAEGLLDGKAPGAGGDIDEAIDAIFSVGDPPNTPFEDPQAHGPPQARVDALGVGYDGGLDACGKEYGPGFSTQAGSPVKPSNSAKADVIGGP